MGFEMKDNFEDNSEELELIQRFEQTLENNDTAFFDINDFEVIIDHYTANFEYTKALAACDVAIAQYPFSAELQIDKAQLLAMAGSLDDALALINEVAEVESGNPDIHLTRGIIFSQRGEYRGGQWPDVDTVLRDQLR